MNAQTNAAHDAPIPRGSNAFTCGRGAGSHSQRGRMQVGDACISESIAPWAAVCPLLEPPNYSQAGDPPSPSTPNGGRCAGEASEPLLSACTAGHLTPGADASGVLLAAMRLSLLTDIHKAKRQHRSTAALRERLRLVTAEAMA